MTKINVDTTKLKEYGSELVKYSNELEKEFNKIFNALENISTTGAWNGDAAYQYILSTKKDRKQYESFNNSIYKDGKTLYVIGEYIEREVKYL